MLVRCLRCGKLLGATVTQLRADQPVTCPACNLRLSAQQLRAANPALAHMLSLPRRSQA